MTKYAGGLLFSLAVVLTMVLGTAVTAADKEDDKEIKEAQKDILDLAKIAENGKGKAIEAKVTAIKKKYEDLGTLMHIYKPKNKGGLGFGALPTSGLETKIRDLSKRKLAPLTLAKETDELIRMAHVNIALGDITKLYFSKDKNGKTKKDWDKHLEDQKKAAKELIDAVKAKNAVKLKAAAENLDNACNNCHSDFRD
jgi:cytochrome c556